MLHDNDCVSPDCGVVHDSITNHSNMNQIINVVQDMLTSEFIFFATLFRTSNKQ